MEEPIKSEKIENAIAAFRNPYSCAQTIYAAFADTVDEEKLAYYKAMSGGRCEGGFCGALFAARNFVPEEKRGELDKFFEENTGALSCREIKANFKTPCADCVKFAAEGILKFSK